MGQKERATTDPDALEAAGKFIRLIRSAPKPAAFLRRVSDGDIEGARSMIGLSDEDFHSRVTAIREQAEAAAERHPEIAEMSKEEFLEQEHNR